MMAVLCLAAAMQPSRAGAEPPVALDAGHTPLRPGAVSPGGRIEYRFNRDLSDALAQHLQKQGVPVVRTAAEGEEIELRQRTQVAPQAELFVSIHHDSIQQAWIDAGRRKEFSGYSLFVSEKNPAYDRSLRCAKAIGARMQAAGEHPSLYHATPIAGENRPLIDAALGIHRFDDLVVLKTATMPAVLVEAGVIANPDEEVRLARPETQERLAEAIAQGIHDCLKP
ncbi:N-acetylmuramoyl-L-alanine amidase [Niveibacterium sp. SC-1]|uniref:N-acetylmuramoyl-L-alanine amidase n=1 Tax=Niveibacterium sp. SC-1 TaxID=3135646 RepID=UPI00311E33B2